jgi:membrane protease YdiL (CAAX protease family)
MIRFDSEALGSSGWLFLFLHGVYLPFRAWQSRARLLGAPTPPSRATYFTGTIVRLALLLPLTLVVAFLHHIDLYPRGGPGAAGWLLALFTLGAMLVLMWPRWRAAVSRGDRRIRFLMPGGREEQALWIALAGMAAFVEESTYRGVLFSLILWTTGSVAIATLVSAAAFALAHALQSRYSMAVLFVYGVLLQFLALQSGSLYLPMLVHFLHDVIAGFTFARLGREEGALPEEPASS